MTWWMVLLLIFGILFLIGCIPVGVDAAYLGGSFTLKVKIWLLRQIGRASCRERV